MRRLLAGALALALLTALSATPAVALNGGTFWLTDGANGTGDARAFDILPERIVDLPGLRYNTNCGASCGLMDNTVSSVVFSCGVSGVPIDQSDWIRHYLNTGAMGSYQHIDPNYPGACSNGKIIINTGTFAGSSITTNE